MGTFRWKSFGKGVFFHAKGDRELKASRQGDKVFFIHSTTSGIQNSTIFPDFYAFFSKEKAVLTLDLLRLLPKGPHRRCYGVQIPARLSNDLSFRAGCPDADPAVGISGNQDLPLFYGLAWLKQGAAAGHCTRKNVTVPCRYNTGDLPLLLCQLGIRPFSDGNRCDTAGCIHTGPLKLRHGGQQRVFHSLASHFPTGGAKMDAAFLGSLQNPSCRDAAISFHTNKQDPGRQIQSQGENNNHPQKKHRTAKQLPAHPVNSGSVQKP